MTVEIRMPALTDTMESGSLSEWLVEEGDKISKGDAIAEVETDKAVIEVESPATGILGKIHTPAGTEDVPVGAVIASFSQCTDQAADVVADEAPTPTPKAATPANAPRPVAPPAHVVAKPPPADGRTRVSPVAKRMASQTGIDLSAIQGSGPDGRVVKRDVVKASVAVDRDGESSSKAPYQKLKLTNTRKVIARRLVQSKLTAPHFYLTIDVDVDNLLAQRREMNAALADQDIKLSMTDFTISATAFALDAVPEVNAQYTEEAFIRFSRADIAVAVAVDGGLVTPVIRDASNKSIAQVSSEMKHLSARARKGKLTPEEYQGGTFSISNLGMYGVREFSAVINPPQGAILAVGCAEPRAVVRDGVVVSATMMTCTLSCDHRVIDGATAAEFLNAFKHCLENPQKIIAER